MKAGAAAACRPKSARASWSRHSGSWTLPSAASAARKCRSPILATSKWRRSRRCPGSSRRRKPRLGEREDLPVVEFRMPALGADMEAGTLVEWLVKPGDRVKKGDVVAVVETQKGAIEVEIFEEGIVSQLVVPVGTKVPVGGVLAHIGSGAPPQPVPSPPPTAPAPAESRPAMPEAAKAPQPVAALSGAAGARITPAARRRAAELGIDVAGLSGTGIDGAVTLADIELAARARTAARPEASAI